MDRWNLSRQSRNTRHHVYEYTETAVSFPHVCISFLIVTFYAERQSMCYFNDDDPDLTSHNNTQPYY